MTTKNEFMTETEMLDLMTNATVDGLDALEKALKDTQKRLTERIAEAKAKREYFNREKLAKLFAHLEKRGVKITKLRRNRRSDSRTRIDIQATKGEHFLKGHITVATHRDFQTLELELNGANTVGSFSASMHEDSFKGNDNLDRLGEPWSPIL